MHLFGGEHMLGGISGAYLLRMLKHDKSEWVDTISWFREYAADQAEVISKPVDNPSN
jgi:hypothetical protein